jgi:DNA-binding transcriptional ArsR family regulator
VAPGLINKLRGKSPVSRLYRSNSLVFIASAGTFYTPVGSQGFSVVEDVNDVRVVKALAHPIRVAALALLEEQVLSPKDVAEKLDVTIPLASYHVRQLQQFGLIELVRTTPRRGTVQHFYRAKRAPKISDVAWGQIPLIVKREMVAAALGQANSAMAAAASEGGFDRGDAHASRTSFELDERGWKQLVKMMAKTVERVEQIQADAAARISTSHIDDANKATVLLMLFEGPYTSEPRTLTQDAPSGKGRRRNKQPA